MRFADFDGDGFDDIFSNMRGAGRQRQLDRPAAREPGRRQLPDLGRASRRSRIGGFGGTLLAADFDNDGDVDMFAPNDQTRGDGARNWLLLNDGEGVFTDAAAAAGVETNPPGDAYVPRGGQAVDFDEDGFVDLLFGSRLMLNNGDGTFSDGSAAANLPCARTRASS